jgi:hypothetical protein
LRSKVKVQWRSLWYVTHHLMVMHPHTKYNWPIWKEKKVMVWTSFPEKKQKKQKRKRKRKKKKIRLKQYVSLRSKGRNNNISYEDRSLIKGGTTILVNFTHLKW